jgi:hypothetical protein
MNVLFSEILALNYNNMKESILFKNTPGYCNQLFTNTHMCTFTHTWAHIQSHTRAHSHTHGDIYNHTHMHIHIHIRTFTQSLTRTAKEMQHITYLV